jgi:hypothetical protein
LWRCRFITRFYHSNTSGSSLQCKKVELDSITGVYHAAAQNTQLVRSAATQR